MKSKKGGKIQGKKIWLLTGNLTWRRKWRKKDGSNVPFKTLKTKSGITRWHRSISDLTFLKNRIKSWNKWRIPMQIHEIWITHPLKLNKKTMKTLPNGSLKTMCLTKIWRIASKSKSNRRTVSRVRRIHCLKSIIWFLELFRIKDCSIESNTAVLKV